jgi:hypothetical protein
MTINLESKDIQSKIIMNKSIFLENSLIILIIYKELNSKISCMIQKIIIMQ